MINHQLSKTLTYIYMCKYIPIFLEIINKNLTDYLYKQNNCINYSNNNISY